MYIDLAKSIFTRPARRRRLPSVVLVGIGLVVGAFHAQAPAGASVRDGGRSPEAAAPEVSPGLQEMSARVARVREAWAQAGRYYNAEVAPIERVLLRYRNQRALATRVAVSLVRESNRVGMDPRLLLAVLLVENPWLDPTARSPVGAVGLMQVMPVHRQSYPECGRDLEDVETNICQGARIFARYFRESGGQVERALLRYNGCVNGTNTPTCHQYPMHVFARAGRASVLAWTGTAPAAGSR